MTGSFIPDPLSLILSAAALGQALLCAMLLLLAPKPAPHRYWLAAIFAALAALATGPVSAAMSAALYPLAMGLVLAAVYALPPLIWRYTAQLTQPGGADTPKRGWLHGLPGLAGVAGAVSLWSLPGDARTAMLISGDLPDTAHAAAVALWLFVLVLAWNLVSGAYAVALLRRLARYRHQLRDLFSNNDGRELHWLSGIIAVIAAVWGLSATILLIDNLLVPLPLPASLGALMLIALIGALALGGLRQSPGLQAADLAPATSSGTGTGKYHKSALGKAQAQRIADRLETAMRGDHLYLDPGLSLQKLSRHIGVAPNLVSQTLNQKLEETFFDFVNRYRIEAALPRVAEGNDTILTIALDVGFNTRSTFYSAFKQVSGTTPRAYRDAASPSTD